MRQGKPVVSHLRLGQSTYRVSIQRMARKTLSMHVDGNELCVKAPLIADQQAVLNWVASKQKWIEKRISLIDKMKLGENEIWYLGHKVTVSSGDQTIIGLQGIRLKRGASLDAAMRRHALELLTSVFNNATQELGYIPKTLKFRTMTKSWGRCTSKGQITLNTRLIACDPRFIRYVCIHELAHLKHLNHAPAFWDIVKKHVPDLTAVKKLSILIHETDRFDL
jgi:predicted metal-dependent hydrolase